MNADFAVLRSATNGDRLVPQISTGNILHALSNLLSVYETTLFLEMTADTRASVNVQ